MVTCNASSISILLATGDKRAGSAGASQFGCIPTVLQCTFNCAFKVFIDGLVNRRLGRTLCGSALTCNAKHSLLFSLFSFAVDGGLMRSKRLLLISADIRKIKHLTTRSSKCSQTDLITQCTMYNFANTVYNNLPV